MEQKTVILVVDDEIDTLELTELILSSEGFEVWTADSGPAALAILERGKGDEEKQVPDLILLDMKMPTMDGLAVCRKIRTSLDPKIASLVVIMFSARDSPEYVQEAKEAGAQDLITKPFDFDNLIERVNMHVKKQ
ncbi:MAG: PleD family two-component system response regulator [Candidatus Heimdallarchaeota archaeon]